MAAGREVLLGDQVVDLYSARDLTVSGHAELAATTIALGDLAVESGSLRVDREAIRTFAVGGSVSVAETATIVFPKAGALKYGTIRTGAAGSRETILRDPEAVAGYAEIAPSLASSASCFDRTASTGIVRASSDGLALTGDGVSGLQVFTVEQDFVGEITVSRIPVNASVLVNVIGDSAVIAPGGRDWSEIAPSTLVNVVSAIDVEVDAARGLRLNTLVGSTDAQVTIVGDRLTGTMLSLGSVAIGDTRFEHGAIEAPLLPECSPVEPSLQEEPVPTATQPTARTDESISTSTTTTTTTTTTVLAGSQIRGSRAVPGAAFALGGAATASRWWLGVPLTLAGSVLLGWGWIEEQRRSRREWEHRRRATVRVLVRAGLTDRS